MSAKGKRGGKRELLKIELPFDEAVKAALETRPPPKTPPKQKKQHGGDP